MLHQCHRIYNLIEHQFRHILKVAFSFKPVWDTCLCAKFGFAECCYKM